jgi:DNA-binding GntR family transcriptional regulator
MPPKRRLLMQQAYDEIKRRIVTLELRPGQRIDDVELATQLALSRTPIREAIFLLGSEGLIDVNSDIGIIVRPVGLTDISHLIEMQFVVAKTVARLAATRMRPDQLNELRLAAAAVEAAIERRDPLAITSTNATFHRVEAASVDNSRLEGVARTLEDERQRLAYVCFGGTREWGRLDEHFKKVIVQHASLVKAYEAHDPVAAEVVAVEHVRLFRNRILQYLTSEEIEFTLSDSELDAISLRSQDGLAAMLDGDGVTGDRRRR